MTTSEKYLVPEQLNIVTLDCNDAYAGLGEKDRNYAYCFYRASWAGAVVVARQISEESPYLLELAKKLFTPKSFVTLSKLPKTDSEPFLNYWASLCGSLGNYQSYGDTKFIPRLPIERFDHIVETIGDAESINLYKKLRGKIYSLSDSEKTLGFFPNGVSGYYLNNMTEDEIKLVDRYLTSKNIEGWNTRVSKIKHSDSQIYVVEIASADVHPEKNINIVDEFEQTQIIISCKDHWKEMDEIMKWLTKALQFANNVQQKMLQHYIEHFKFGDIQQHKQSQRYWVKDVRPVVETNIGFIESYRDPSGVRAEFEGLVAIVNKQKSKKYNKLVENAEKYIAQLPWDPMFEKDKFNRPDFTSLDVLGFCTSGLPIGINIPNYDDIRMDQGFKNVNLGNVVEAITGGTSTPQFIPLDDVETYKKYSKIALDICVATHELLGHGSGKLLYSGNHNESKVRAWCKSHGGYKYGVYQKGDTWSSKFGRLSSAYEECRAEACGLYFSTIPEIAKLFGATDDTFEDVVYTGWIQMMVSAVKGTDSYDLEKQVWMQAHSQARYVLMKVLKQSNLLKIKFDDQSLTLVLDKSKIMTDGKRVIGGFLETLQVIKATADVEGGVKLFANLSQFDEDDMKMLETYQKVKKPRPLLVQPTLTQNMKYVTYDPTPEGAIKSVIDKLE